MKKVMQLFAALLFYNTIQAQYSGLISIPSNSFSTLSVFINSLNAVGVSGSLTVEIASGYSEQAPFGGYSLTASGSLAQPIVFRKGGTGSNPKLYAYSGGNGTPGTMFQDGIWRLIGCDFITIEGIDLLDTNQNNPQTMEFGIGFFKADAGNGCQNNMIKNCKISLNRINNASGNGPAESGSRAIDVVNASSNVHNSAITVTSSAGTHSYNRFFGNEISNCNIGFSLIGYAATTNSLLTDQFNEVGGNSVQLGNRILNFGGGGSSNASLGIKCSSQFNLNVSHNLIMNNDGNGINHAATLKGVQINLANHANVAVVHNTISIQSGGVNQQLVMIENSAGSLGTTNKIRISENLLTQCTYTGAVTPTYYGIWNTGSPSVLSILQNTFANNSSHATSGSSSLIYNNGAVADSIQLDSNVLAFTHLGINAYTGTFNGINNANGTTSTYVSICGNVFKHMIHLNATGSGNLYFIQNTNNSKALKIDKNVFRRLALNHSGSYYLIYNSSATQSFVSVCNNSVIGTFICTANGGSFYGYYANGNSGSTCLHRISENNLSAISYSNNGSGVFYGIYDIDGNSSAYPQKNISKNIISNIYGTNSGNFYGMYLNALGDGGMLNGSTIDSNTISNVFRNGNVYGIYLAASTSSTAATFIENNLMYNLQTSGISSSVNAVYLAGSGIGIYFSKNKIVKAIANGTNSVCNGIFINSSASTTLCNNLIGDLNANNSFAANAINGIYINAGSTVQSLYNTIFLNAISTGGNFNSNALYTSSSASLLLVNSILYNTTSGGTGISVALKRSASGLGSYSSSSNNNLFYTGTPSPNRILLQNGSNSYQVFNAMQTLLSPRESSSSSQTISLLTNHALSPNYLHVNSSIPTSLESGGVPVAGLTKDFDNQVRFGVIGYTGGGTSTDTGADEFELNTSPCSSVVPSILTANSNNICAGSSFSVFADLNSNGTGVQYQWKISGLASGPFVNVTSGLGATTLEYVTTFTNPGTYYLVLESTCASNSVSAVSQPLVVNVLALPSASVTAVSSIVCEGSSIHLQAISNVSSQFTWLGPNGFTSELPTVIINQAGSAASGTYSLLAEFNGCESGVQTVTVSVSTISLQLTASSALLCSGNSSTLSLTTSANTYTWSNGSSNSSIVISPTVSGIYSVTVTNSASCLKSSSLSIQLITPSIQPMHSIYCGNSFSGSLSVNAFTPSVINWYTNSTSTVSMNTGNSFSFTSISDTVFYVQATHTLSGCSSLRLPVTLTLAPYPALLLSSTSSIVCPGRPTVLDASGAATYSWVGLGSGSSKTVSPLSNSIYTVQGKSNYGCMSTTTIQITTFTVPNLYVQQSSSSVCPNSTVELTANGALTYTWSTGGIGAINTVTPGSNTSYTVFGTSAQGCIGSTITSVSTRSVPIIKMLQSTDSVCLGEVVTFTAIGAQSFTWLPGGATTHTCSQVINGSSVINAIGKSVNTCTNVGIATVVSIPCTYIETNTTVDTIQLLPNPATNFIHLSFFKTINGTLRILTIYGTEVLYEPISGNKRDIDVSFLVKGIYLLAIETENKQVFIKFIKN